MGKQTRVNRAQRRHDLATLQHAIDAVKSQSMSMRTASRVYGIPRSTLFDKLHGNTPLVFQSKTVLTSAEEQRLVNWVLHMSQIGYGWTRFEVIDTVKRIVETDKRPNPFNNNKPGREWWHGFVQRHPEMSERIPQQPGKERVISTPSKVNQWFTDNKEYIQHKAGKEPTTLQDRLYNAYEFGFSLCTK